MPTSTVYPILCQKWRAMGISTAEQFISATMRWPRPMPLARSATQRHSMQLSSSSFWGLVTMLCLGSLAWRRMQKIGKMCRMVPKVVLVIKRFSPSQQCFLTESVSDMQRPWRRCSCQAFRIERRLWMKPLPSAVRFLSWAVCSSSNTQKNQAAECHVSHVKLKELISPSR